ncbi:hypothetical protein BGZ65_000404 [Modicella reniformis]|uniref:DUF4110 domain-containing protein n=1 Tax=Modicella reniformis TaxID=1440133 RepID=A0A9P6J2Z6_9FUNG|nr:hypothetical protein BGZ65_000404 [Modicella reniformis]
MGKKDKKKSKEKEQHKARVAEKQERKQSKKEQKVKTKNVEEEEEDIETILANFKKEQEEKVRIVEEIWSGPPSRRANATLTANPINSNELIFFGGEFFDGAKCAFYNDLYRYNIEKDEWRRITSPNSPGPRSSHQVAITPAGTLFLFGGEFASPNETQFFHYKDFWSLDMKTNAWEKLEVKPKPSARSGHRMILWKHLVVLFGGFYDNYVDTRYYDDLWVFDTLDYKWIKVELPEQMIRPTARSGFSFIPCNDGVILYGGYCKEYIKGQRPKGILIRWEKKKKSGSAPTPRSGCAMAPYKNRAVLFGGVYDDDVNEETLESTFYNELYTYQIDTGRWFPMNLKKPKTAKKKKPKKGGNKSGGGSGAGGARSDEDEASGGKKEKMKWEESTDDEFDYGDFEESDTEADNAAGTAKKSVTGVGDESGTPQEGLSETGESQQLADEAVSTNKDNNENDSTQVSNKETLAAAALAAAGIVPKSTQTPEPVTEPESTKNKNSGRPTSKSKDNNNNNSGNNDGEEAEEEEPLMPCPRYNPMLAVQKSTLFIFGGILEIKDREYTLDDFFSLNLDKMTEYVCLRQSEFESQLWLGEDSDDDEGEEDEDGEDEGEEGEEEEEEEDDDDEEDDEKDKEMDKEDRDEAADNVVAESSKRDKKSKKEGKDKKELKEVKEKEKKDKKEKRKKEKKDKDKASTESTPNTGTIDPSTATSSDGTKAEEDTDARTESESGTAESAPEVVPSQLSGVDLAARLAMTEEEAACTPTIGETLREFYGRTTEYWVMKAFEDSTKTGKALRHDGFVLAEAKYNEWQPILAQMAQMRLDAGLDDGDDGDEVSHMGGTRPGRVLKMGEVYNKLMSRHRR